MSQRNEDYKPMNLLKYIRERAENTEDFEELRRKEDIPVFVYGTLKRGHSNNDILKGAKYLGEAETCSQTMNLFDTGGFPVVMDGKYGDSTKSGRILGELFAVSPEHMLPLDRLEANGHMYKREKRFVFMRDQPLRHKDQRLLPNCKAWIYLGVPEYWGKRLTAETPKLHPTKGKYYHEWGYPVEARYPNQRG